MKTNNTKKDAAKSIYDKKIAINNISDDFSFDDALEKILSTPKKEVDKINKQISSEFDKKSKKEDSN